MGKGILLLAIGIILGILTTMVIESSLAINYLRKLRKAEFEIKQLQHKQVQMFDENYELLQEVAKLKAMLKSNGISDYEDK